MHESPEPRQHYLDVRRGGKVPRRTRRRKADLASERIIPRMTGNLEVMSSSVGLIPTNALVLTGLATFRVVGDSEAPPQFAYAWHSRDGCSPKFALDI